VVRHGVTWSLDPDSLLLRDFFLEFFVLGNVSLQTGPPPPIEWISLPPLVTTLITPKGEESPCSGRIGVIGALVYFLPPEVA